MGKKRTAVPDHSIAHGGRVGPSVKEMQRLSDQATRISTQANVLVDGQTVRFTIKAVHGGSSSLCGEMIKVANASGRGQLDLTSVKVRAVGSPIKGKELQELARAAWCEVFGVDVPSATAAVNRERTQKAKRAARREHLLALLHGAPDGVEAWNRHKVEIAGLRDFRRVDLSGLDLTGVIFPSLDMTGACFDDAVLFIARFEWPSTGMKASKGCPYPVLTNARFRNADLRQARLSVCRCPGADFTGARMNHAGLRVCNFRKAIFRDADLSGVDLAYANLREADLRGANLCGADLHLAKLWDARFDGAHFNNATQFPRGFAPSGKMIWQGEGPRP